MPKKQIESGIKRSVKEFLEWHKWYVFRVQNNTFGTPGVCDLIAIRNGRVMFLEIKTDKGKLSPAQSDFARCIREHGGEYRVIKSVDDLY